jgi:hypothetical protein
MREKIIEFLQEYGFTFKERVRTLIHIPCPDCGRDDKFSILKDNGSTICYRGSCSYGKRWFDEFMVKVAGLSPVEAKHRLYGNRLYEAFEDKKPEKEINVSFEDIVIPTIPWPEPHMMPVNSEFAVEAHKYLEGRGVSKEMAAKYGMMFSAEKRRVYFPVTMNGKVVGYQGRAIDNVDAAFKVRNNNGFRRERLVMFLDSVKPGSHAIITEGPFDALKFDLAGGAVCTMGKEVTDFQVKAIADKQPSRVYLALDDDAAKEMNALVNKFQCPVYKIEIPKSCKTRCHVFGKKADFGECTLEEAKQAFLDAYEVDTTSIILHLE